MTDLSGIQQSIQKIAEQAAQDQAKSGAANKGAANAGDVEKLQAALQQQQPGDAAANNPMQAQGVDKVDGVQATSNESPGAKILEHMNSMRTGLQEAVTELNSAVANPNMAPADLLKVQMRLQQVTLQQDLMGKVVAKSEQNVDQLLKGQ
jgi:type III secretion system YscI/HrpB-like protein